MNKKARIYVCGHNGMVGSAVTALLKKKGYKNLILKSSRELDLRNQAAVERFMAKTNPEYVFLFAAKVGGIKANIKYPAEFLYDNLMIESNLIHACFRHKVKKLLYLGSSCVYPRHCPQPMKEKYLFSGKLEPTNEAYALGKIIGLKLCEYYNRQFKTNFITLMAPNLYGPNDNFDLETAHVVSALVKKFTQAKLKKIPLVEVWGTGKARREFMHVDDLAEACLFFMQHYDAKDLPAFINVGCGKDTTIKELAELIKMEAGYKGKIIWNSSLPDGMPQKLLDVTLARQKGWQAKISLQSGIKKFIQWYRAKYISKE